MSERDQIEAGATSKSPAAPPQRPKRGVQPPPRPRRSEVTPPPRPNGGRRTLTRALLVGSIALLGLLLIAGLFSALGLTGQRTTTAADYTAREVEAIILLLADDPACRDTRLAHSFNFAPDNISLELLESVLGQPISKAGRHPMRIWTYKTSDGTVGIPVAGVYDGPRYPVPFVRLDGPVQTFGINDTAPLDTAALKERILRIKSRFDEGDGAALEARRKQEAQKAEAEQAERDRRDVARFERLREERMAAEQDGRQARSEYDELRHALPFGPERDAFWNEGDEWIARRAAVLTATRKSGRESVPLPTVPQVLAAIRSGGQVPVTADEGKRFDALVPETDQRGAEERPQKGPSHDDGVAAKSVQTPAPAKAKLPVQPAPERTTSPAAPVRPLAELNTDRREQGLCVSPDGRRIYFEREGDPTGIFMAERPDSDSPFGTPTKVTAGRHPTLTADERLLIVLRLRPSGRGESLHVARRTSRDEPFPEPQEIPELASLPNPKTPHLSADGLHLVYMAGAGQDRGFFETQRAAVDSPWEKPTSLPMAGAQPGNLLSWPHLTPDRLTLVCADESESGKGRFVIWTRRKPQAPFANPRTLAVPGLSEVFGRSPFFVPATGELFFSSTAPRRFSRYLDQQTQSDWDLWAARLPSGLK